jgi:hypothetical protein
VSPEEQPPNPPNANPDGNDGAHSYDEPEKGQSGPSPDNHCYPNAPQQRYWKSPQNRVAFATLVIIFFTFCVYAVQSCIFSNQLNVSKRATDDAHATNIANLRAWIGPTGATSDTPILNKELRIAIRYANSGKEPAIHTTFASNGFTSTYSDENSTALLGAVNTYLDGCKAGKQKVTELGAAYPAAGNNTYTAFSYFPPADIDQSVIDGTKRLAVTGCFTYVTQGAVHHSTFCFSWRAKTSDLKDWYFCPAGNDAD